MGDVLSCFDGRCRSQSLHPDGLSQQRRELLEVLTKEAVRSMMEMQRDMVEEEMRRLGLDGTGRLAHAGVLLRPGGQVADGENSNSACSGASSRRTSAGSAAGNAERGRRTRMSGSSSSSTEDFDGEDAELAALAPTTLLLTAPPAAAAAAAAAVGGQLQEHVIAERVAMLLRDMHNESGTLDGRFSGGRRCRRSDPSDWATSTERSVRRVVMASPTVGTTLELPPGWERVVDPPADGGSWDWPLSRPECKARVKYLEEMEVAAEVQDLRQRVFELEDSLCSH